MHHLSLASTTWHIGATWSCKQFQAYRWLQKVKPYCNPCMSIFLTFLGGTWGMGNWSKKIPNKRFENPSQFQNLMDIHAWTCHTCFGLV